LVLKIVETAKELIAFRSLTGMETPVMEHVESLLRGMGWTTERWTIPNDLRFNLFAKPAGREPRVIFTTHLDVVPAPEGLFTPTIVDGVLFGRGACDTKGIAAVMIQVADSLRRDGHDDIGLLFVVGEETDSVGARIAVPMLRERGVEFIVNGEPTEGKLVIAQKGVLAGKIIAKGRSCHSGYPHLGVDANAFLIDVASDLRSIDFGAHPVFGKSTLNIGMLKGGEAGNIVSPSAELSFWLRTVTSSHASTELLHSVVQSVARGFPGIEVSVTIDVESEPIELVPLAGFETTVFCGGSDISYYVGSGAKVLMYGPGSLTHAHTDTEHIAARELGESFNGYRSLYHAIKNGMASVVKK
jgi:acetylornithine deacetylase